MSQSPDLHTLCTQQNNAWAHAHLERTPALFHAAQSPKTLIDDTSLLLFSSSNYLGLSTHPAIITAAHDALAAYGTGSGGSRLTTGSTAFHTKVEKALPTFLELDAHYDCVFFSSGYLANLSTIQALAQLAQLCGGSLKIFSDERNHASIIDGCRIARVPTTIFSHYDYTDLEEKLAKSTADYALVISDGVFSMDGTIADLAQLRRVCDRYGAWLMVDDAHGIGTIGRRGKGICECYPHSLPDILVVTASKALGAEGGMVLAHPEITRFLRNHARAFIFSTSTSAANCAAIDTALSLLAQDESIVQRLHTNVAYLLRLLDEAEIAVSRTSNVVSGGWASPIVIIPLGAEDYALSVSQQLRDYGFHVPAIRYPTVKRGEAILRITLMASHTQEHIAALVRALSGILSAHA
ncbi:aminotransferase class I/II-fold pyridoxal phosphate-dependent enzyme [Corynebacterium sp. sy039]|uniref:aminotransferase class I/II-fold pyridoxal phosphate-dependent enzyme n=1 Tax=Corynebacterium sp. sy039 TaxID=2599641 RepID=UPI001FF072AA|nr:aminotransferase class I/II-fold pyridoxal phosphate-dependent enzyme [Corynebacterium sp. sy039]